MMPLGTDKIALLALDAWEHAYCFDHRNGRAAFIAGFWPHVNGRACASRLGRDRS